MSSVMPVRFAVLAAGSKGFEYLEGLLGLNIRPDIVFSYPQKGDASQAFDCMQSLAEVHGIQFENNRRPTLQPDRLHFAVGWQYLISGASDTLIVFHDSLLPRYRGFAPTVAALINGDNKIGVTALQPAAEVDAGPVYASASRSIEYPMKIADALSMQASMMVSLTETLVQKYATQSLELVEQDHEKATYSIWRDELDYWIDWAWSADKVVRTIDSLGFPYEGARSAIDGDPLVLNEATVVPDLNFEIRQPGKIWSLQNKMPVVVCGTGCVQIRRATQIDGTPFEFKKLRSRFSGP